MSFRRAAKKNDTVAKTWSTLSIVSRSSPSISPFLICNNVLRMNKITRSKWFKISLLGGVTAISMFILYNLIRRRRQKPKSKEIVCTTVGHLKKIYIYPLIGGRKCTVASADCNEFGLSTIIHGLHLMDRSFIIYSEDTLQYQDASNHPNISQISMKPVIGGKILLECKENGEIFINLPTTDKKNKRELKLVVGCPLFPSIKFLSFWDCGNKVAQWISSAVVKEPNNLRLGYLDEESRKQINRFNALKHRREFNDTLAGVNDIFVLDDKAVKEIYKDSQQKPLCDHGFRPNLVVLDLERNSALRKTVKCLKVGNVLFQSSSLPICDKWQHYLVPRQVCTCKSDAFIENQSFSTSILQVTAQKSGKIYVGAPIYTIN